MAAKFGVHFTVVKVGKYKSFTETYTEDKMSDANRQQVHALYQRTLATDARRMFPTVRKISKDSLNHYADGLMVFDDSKLLKSRKFVDGFCYYDEIRNIVKKRLGLKADQKISSGFHERCQCGYQ